LKNILKKGASSTEKHGELARLRARLANAEQTLRIIRTGEVDTVVVPGKDGPQVFTLKGAEHAYRLLIESMNEGALTLTAGKMILYANQCFARMVKCPLEQVMGSSFRQFLSTEDQASLRQLLKQANKAGSKIQVRLKVSDGTQIPAQISIRLLAKNGFAYAPIGVVVTDLTEARRQEELLRALTHRVVQVQEAERGRVALELHDNITQLLCAAHFRSQTLVGEISGADGPAKVEAMKLRDMLGKIAEEVEHISRNLRPGVLDELGLEAVLHATSKEFAHRSGISVKLANKPLTERLPAEAELALYRVLQEALKNVEKHARARQVKVSLTRQGIFIQLAIKDDGVGFDHVRHLSRGKDGLGLLSMKERAYYVGGTLKIKSDRQSGTEIKVRIPHPPKAKEAIRKPKTPLKST